MERTPISTILNKPDKFKVARRITDSEAEEYGITNHYSCIGFFNDEDKLIFLTHTDDIFDARGMRFYEDE